MTNEVSRPRADLPAGLRKSHIDKDDLLAHSTKGDLREILPECAVCNKPVEKFHAKPDFDKQATIFIAWCHGEMDEFVIPRLYFIEGELQKGKAFTKKKLEKKDEKDEKQKSLPSDNARDVP